MHWRRGGSSGGVTTARSASSADAGLIRFARNDRELIILQQPLDIIELDLRPRRIGKTAPQLFEDAADPLHIDFARDHPRQLVIFVRPQRTPERVGRVGTRLLPAGALARTVALLTVALLHRLRHALGALAQGLQRPALRVDRGVGIAFSELVAGIAHRRIGFAQAVLVVALVAAAGLALLATLSGVHATLGEFLLQFLQPVAQALLVLLQVAHALVALLAVHAVAPRILPLLEGLVAQLLLLADHVAELVERLLHVAVALAGL